MLNSVLKKTLKELKRSKLFKTNLEPELLGLRFDADPAPNFLKTNKY
jgi:hypothetical protein